MTAASVRAGISRLGESDFYYDAEGNPIITSFIDGISDAEDDVVRMGDIAKYCLNGLLVKYFQDLSDSESEISLLLGIAPLSRPGPRYEGRNKEIANKLLQMANQWAKNVSLQVIACGNPSAIRCIEIARQLLKHDPYSLCIVGGMDSLLALDTLDWFEDAGRLKSVTFGRNQGFPPGEAVGFMIIEAEQGALLRKKRALAELIGVGLAVEPAPFLSEQPSKGEGLTHACRTALSESSCDPTDIDVVLSDLDGEFFRSKEWGCAELRCFGSTNTSRHLWHLADCMGSVGAASGAILINTAAVALSRGWIKRYAMVFCSDDEGERGAVVLK